MGRSSFWWHKNSDVVQMHIHTHTQKRTRARARSSSLSHTCNVSIYVSFRYTSDGFIEFQIQCMHGAHTLSLLPIHIQRAYDIHAYANKTRHACVWRRLDFFFKGFILPVPSHKIQNSRFHFFPNKWKFNRILVFISFWEKWPSATSLRSKKIFIHFDILELLYAVMNFIFH